MKARKTRPGRPSTYDPGTAGRFCELVADGASDRKAAAELGISRATVKAWEASHDDFSATLTRAREERPAALECVALEAVQQMDALSRTPESTPAMVQATKYKFDMALKMVMQYQRTAEKKQEMEQARSGGALPPVPGITPEQFAEAVRLSQESFERIKAQIEFEDA